MFRYNLPSITVFLLGTMCAAFAGALGMSYGYPWWQTLVFVVLGGTAFHALASATMLWRNKQAREDEAWYRQRRKLAKNHTPQRWLEIDSAMTELRSKHPLDTPTDV